MPDDTHQRLYNDKEIQALLRRATELQEGHAAPAAFGLSLAEIEQIAAETGIAPEYIQAAAADLEGAAPADKPSRFWGGPFFLQGGRVVPGEITAEQWIAMVQELRRIYGKTGTTEKLGDALEWMSGPQLEEVQVTVERRDRRTKIQVVNRQAGAAVVCYLLGTSACAFVMVGTVGVLGWPPLAELMMIGGSIAGGGVAVRALFGRWTRKLQRKQAKLLDRLQAIAQPAPRTGAEADSTGPLLTEIQRADLVLPSVVEDENRNAEEHRLIPAPATTSPHDLTTQIVS